MGSVIHTGKPYFINGAVIPHDVAPFCTYPDVAGGIIER